MSMINGEKARAAVNRKKRNARRVSDRAKLAELKSQAQQAAPIEKTPAPKKRAAPRKKEVEG